MTFSYRPDLGELPDADPDELSGEAEWRRKANRRTRLSDAVVAAWAERNGFDGATLDAYRVAIEDAQTIDRAPTPPTP